VGADGRSGSDRAVDGRPAGAGLLGLEPLLVVVVSCLLAAIAIAPALDAGFVYDDHRQIVENRLIQDPAYLGQALTSDVWSFKGERGEPWSAYWRPVFVAWLALCYHAFGLADTLGWHLASVALHGVAVGLAWMLFRRLGAGRGFAWSVALLFAVHPVHVESVAWISGSPDLLAAVFTLASLLLVLGGADAGRGDAQAPDALSGAGVGGGWWLVASGWLAGGLALLSKEVAIGLPILAAAALWLRPSAVRPTARARTAEIVRLALLPGAAVVAAYLAARFAVLGGIAPRPPVAMSTVELGLTAIRALAFYLRQSFLPTLISPSYPLRAVSSDGAALVAVAAPMVLVAVAGAVALVIARRSVPAAFGIVVFVVCLAPALKVDSFLPDHIVHDRYLYLAVLGPISLMVSAAARCVDGTRAGPATRQALIGGAVVLAVAMLAARSRTAAGCWTSDLTLWECAVAGDPGSAYNRAQLADTLLAAGRPADAIAEAERALEISPATTALLVRADVLTATGHPAEAVVDLKAIVDRFPDHSGAWERLAVAYQSQGELGAAESSLRIARDRVPWRACSLTANLAVVLVMQGRPADALAELRTVLDSTEDTSVCRLAPYYAARLELGQGRVEDGAALLRDFLVRSEGHDDADTLDQRRDAERTLEMIRSRP
jgi:tetratricopeptide (TPR) repeat protein